MGITFCHLLLLFGFLVASFAISWRLQSHSHCCWCLLSCLLCVAVWLTVRCDACVDRTQLILTVHFLPSLNFATVCVTLIPHETASTISGGYESLSTLLWCCSTSADFLSPMFLSFLYVHSVWIKSGPHKKCNNITKSVEIFDLSLQQFNMKWHITSENMMSVLSTCKLKTHSVWIKCRPLEQYC